ncbi:hypothetical protein HMPREF9961_1386 [Streptococcus australis ATCC 700641]|nr:hypothetical protein HMPREF9961_1386 [Streptococcus australis ATCC 700641]
MVHFRGAKEKKLLKEYEENGEVGRRRAYFFENAKKIYRNLSFVL